MAQLLSSTSSMGEDNREKITKYLSTFITEHKLNLIEEVLAQRTNHITVALEDIYQSGLAEQIGSEIEYLHYGEEFS